jgi:hypothetical protein
VSPPRRPSRRRRRSPLSRAGHRSSSSVAFSCTVSDVPEESISVEEGSEVFAEAQEEEYFSEGDDLED